MEGIAMDIVSQEELRALAGAPRGRCVSIFQPTHRGGSDTRTYVQEDLVRFKNLLRGAEQRLEAAGVATRDAQELLRPARTLLDDAEFWQYQSDGLAVFLAPSVFRTYRVPLPVPELVVVADAFHLKPLLTLLSGDGVFYVLALSQNAVRLLEATRDRVSEVDLSTAPRSLQEALRYDDPERQLQFHTGAPGPGGRRAAMFHGHGVGTDDAKDNLLRYCQQIDRGLGEVLRGSQTPLVLAAVESVQAVYRKASTQARLLDAGIPGNPEALRAEELRARAWPLVEPEFRRAREAALARYRELAGTGKATSALELVLPAAAQGRIDVLFVPVGVQRWGRFDPESTALELHDDAKPGDDDLLNHAAVHTVLSRGTVYAVPPGDMPDGAPVAAVFRY
jgi:hypothetical protein